MFGNCPSYLGFKQTDPKNKQLSRDDDDDDSGNTHTRWARTQWYNML